MDLINKYLKEQTPGHEYEYDYEGDMAKTQLNMMLDAATELKMMLDNDTNLPEWVQSKITKAADYLDSARDYMKNMNKDSNGNMHNEPMGEETKDTGWQKAQTDRRDQYGNPVKNVARRLARQGMQAAIKDLKKGPEAGKRQVEEVEELDELSKSTLASYAKKATQDSRMSQRTAKDFERHELQSRKPEYKAGAKEWKDKYQERAFKRQVGANKAIDRLAKEEVELDEALRHEIAGAVGQFIGNKIDPVHGDIMRVHGKEAYRQAAFHIRKTVNDVKDAVSSLHDRLHKQLRTGGLATEEVELDELKEPTVQKYITRAKFSTNPKRRAMAQKAQTKLQQKKNPMKTEEVEELEELKRRTLASYTSKAADQMANAAIDKSTGAAMGTMGRMSDMPDLAKKGSDKEDKAFSTILKRTKGITSASRRLAKEEAELEEELSSSQRDTHFSLMNKHGLLAKSAKGAEKDKHRMAALDHQMALRNPENSQSRSKALSLSNKLGVKEDSDVISKYSKLGEAKYPGFRVRTTLGGPKLPRRGYGYVPQGDQDPRTGLPLGFSPAKEEPKKSEPTKTKQS